MTYNFFAYLSRLKNINRWSLMRNTQTENVKEHSFDVVMIAHALCMIENKVFGGNVNEDRVIKLAIYHEAGEVFTGDIPTPIKYFNPNIISAFKNVEDECLEKLVKMLPEELREEFTSILFHDNDEDYIYVKAADRICAYIKCIEEIKQGNYEFEKAKNSTENKLANMNLKCVRYFMENFVGAYALSLDELTGDDA